MRLRNLGLFSLLCTAPVLAEVDFAHEVVPLLQKHCVECHGGEKSKGGFSMNTRALVLDADVTDTEKPDRSLLLELVLSDDPDEKMPPPDKGKDALTPDEVDILRRWMAADLPWEEGFTFAEDRYEPPLKPRPVEVPEGAPGTNPIDLLVREYFTANEITPPEPVSDEVFLRRLWMDVLGLPPGEDARAMLSASGRLDRDAAIERALGDSTRYAEHWMTFWNDLLRNEYSGTGYIDGGRTQVTAWLYKGLLENKAYDDFVRELMVKPEAKGFIGGIKWRGEVNASQTREIQFSQNVSQVLLGINMKCASCHDSFIDSWKLEDAYNLAAIYSEKPLELHRCDKPTGQTAKAAWIFPELGQIDPEAPRDKRLAQLADLMTHPENGRMQRTIVNRLWDRLMGRGIVHPVDAMGTEPWSEPVLDLLANKMVESDYDLKAVLKLILTSRTYQSKAVVRSEESGPYVFRGPVRKRMTAEQFLDSIRRVTGVWPKPDGKAFKGGAQGGQLKAVMDAHGLKDWDNRPIRTVFAPRDALQAALGRPNREQVVSARPDLLTTLEAINLANGPELSGLLKEGAKQLMAQPDPAAVIDRLFLEALTRKPTTEERMIAEALVGKPATAAGMEDLLWMVFMLPEFHYVN
ncbi:hypothetical protein HAHE_14270 [Haloferula helveola]|uniref:Planctomycete cytochrome C n=1 Tax=Haloferula helveola TaxID=490095 RepID=A0ABN6H4N7_9BACT|nr:hypothetical protein HAHE_14270 [Haloferula helveola]